MKVERVRWFRARAARDRYKEELEILDEEFRRTQHSFTRTSEIWKKIGEKTFALKKGCRVASGYRAFAHQQATIYARLADGAIKHWVEARELVNPPAKGKAA